MYDTWRCVTRDRCMARNDTPIYRSVFFGRVPQGVFGRVLLPSLAGWAGCGPRLLWCNVTCLFHGSNKLGSIEMLFGFWLM
jgi:hypothetical protein